MAFKSAPGASGSDDSFAMITDGFLGTGFSTAVELSFIAMAVITLVVGFGTIRYMLQGSDLEDELSDAVSLRND